MPLQNGRQHDIDAVLVERLLPTVTVLVVQIIQVLVAAHRDRIGETSTLGGDGVFAPLQVSLLRREVPVIEEDLYIFCLAIFTLLAKQRQNGLAHD